MSCGCGCGGEAVAYENWNEHTVDDNQNAIAAEYQGRSVTLNKPFRTKGANKKFGVYTKNEKGNVVLVRFGDPNMEIKRDDPARRKSFRSRHNCDSPGPKWKARYWSCRQWRGGTKVEADDGSPCGCGCNDDEEVEAKRADDPCTSGYEQYGMKMKNGRKVPNCVPIKKEKAEAEYKVCSSCTTQAKCAEMGECMKAKMEKPSMEDALKEAALPTPKEDESHEAFMSRCQAMGNSKEECMKAHEGHEFDVEGYKKKKDEYASECGYGEEMVDGECKKVAVTIDLEVNETTAMIEASTGQTIIEIKGVAFHDGFNKNNWSLTNEGAKMTAMQMEGADLTLNHPDPNPLGPGFGRATEGLDKSNVGYIKSATYLPKTDGGYEVRYIAHVTQPELFDILESGIYTLKEDYGVSIGGSGVPVKADDDGIVFGEDFTFDHLAIVYRPAYPQANIESVKRIEDERRIEATLISHSISDDTQPTGDLDTMSEDTVETPDINDKIEELTASLVLAESRVAEFEAAEEARVEEARMALVNKASEIGMTGHDDLRSETLESLIASWEAAHPEPSPVVMEEVTSEPSTEVDAPVIASEEAKPVVANYLNGSMVESDEDIYSRCYNAWAKAWNGTLARNESNMRAKTYDEIKEMI